MTEENIANEYDREDLKDFIANILITEHCNNCHIETENCIKSCAKIQETINAMKSVFLGAIK